MNISLRRTRLNNSCKLAVAVGLSGLLGTALLCTASAPAQEVSDTSVQDAERLAAENYFPIQLGVMVGRTPRNGVLILSVAPDSAAQRAGLKPGDYLLTINDREVESAVDMANILDPLQAGSQASLGIWRNGNEQTLSVTFNQQDLDRREIAIDHDPSHPATRPGWLGAAIRNQPVVRERGVWISEIVPDSAADRAGLRHGDRILKIGDESIASTAQMMALIPTYEPNDEVLILIERDGQQQELTATLGARPWSEVYLHSPSRQPGYDDDFYDEDAHESDLPPAHNATLRRVMQQNERLERLILDLQQDVDALRASIRNDSVE